MDRVFWKLIEISKIWVEFLKNRSINRKYGSSVLEIDPDFKNMDRVFKKSIEKLKIWIECFRNRSIF